MVPHRAIAEIMMLVLRVDRMVDPMDMRGGNDPSAEPAEIPLQLAMLQRGDDLIGQEIHREQARVGHLEDQQGLQREWHVDEARRRVFAKAGEDIYISRRVMEPVQLPEPA